MKTDYTAKLDFLTLAVLPSFRGPALGELIGFASYRASTRVFLYSATLPRVYGRYTSLNRGKQVALSVVQEATSQKRRGRRVLVQVGGLNTPVLPWDVENAESEIEEYIDCRM